MNPWYVTIRNISVLIGVAIATVAVWILSVLPLMLHQSWATFVILPTGHCGVTSIDLTITTIFAGWTFILGRLSRFIFVGRFASWFRLASLMMSVAMFLFAQGLFMPANLFSPCVFPHLALAAGVIAIAWYVHSHKIPDA
ncbi:MAG TPA: hypothetical protein VE344_04390 [Methylomirabilota bacterium]|nr:hypothetical protein [Methylomirabilota bacterium]